MTVAAEVVDFDIDKIEGLSHDFVKLIMPHSEASAFALLAQFVTFFGNAIGNSAFVSTEADKQKGNLFFVIVGNSSKARKGTSLGHVKRIFEKSSPEWFEERVSSGLSSGEGLANFFHKDEESGSDDKRLLIIEPEFASVLKVLAREGSTLSAVLRNAWDGGALNVLTRKEPISVQGAHISIVGHITELELSNSLSLTDMANGFGNRFLWGRVSRSKLLPLGGSLDPKSLDSIVTHLRSAIRFGREQREVKLSEEAKDLWVILYEKLAVEKPGVVGMLGARAEPIILRLAMLFSLMDLEGYISAKHLWMASDVWDYCDDSLSQLFGDSALNPRAKKIGELVKSKGVVGISRSGIHSFFSNKLKKEELDLALEQLVESGDYEIFKTSGSGRSSECYKYTKLSNSETSERS